MDPDVAENYELSLEAALEIIHSAENHKVEINYSHKKTEAFIRNNALLHEDIVEILVSLKCDDYIKGPVPDDKPGANHTKPVWIFKKYWRDTRLYIKVKLFIKNRKTYVVSIHIDEPYSK